MIEIGDRPMLWHLMQFYAAFGHNEFIICAGYKQQVIREWVECGGAAPFDVTVVDTGLDTMTGGRIKRVQPYVGNEPFMLTYGDGVCDVDIGKLVAFHRSHGKLATLTSVRLEPQKGILDIGSDNAVQSFREKSIADGAPINAGFMVLEPGVFDYLGGDDVIFEREPLERLAAEGQLMSYFHEGFWQCMDTHREKIVLERLWSSGRAPWKVWDD
jgi:glucose-1-phosphate cytidylyltransferase